MSAGTGRWRRLAVRLVQHAAWVLPGAGTPWAEAMRRELDYIGDEPAALRWALGCIVASYRTRLAASSWFGARSAWRWVTTSRLASGATSWATSGATTGVVMLLIGLALQGYARGQTEPPTPAFPTPAFNEAACALPAIPPDIAPRLRCGTVNVPRDYGHPGAGVFKLAIVVVHTRSDRPQPDPVLYIHGGPGSSITASAAWIARNESPALAPDRDLVLVDQRGSGRSEPELCPDLARRQLALAGKKVADDTLLAAVGDTYRACREELARQEIEPAWFGTAITVRDLEVVRQALGFPRWNVYGRSYGTTVGMTLMARHPETLRAVVLDSVYPPDPLPLTRPQTFAAALDGLFAACHADGACAAAHPDLAGMLHETMVRLEAAPMPVTMPAGAEPKLIWVGPWVFRSLVFQSLYSRASMASVPRMIQAAHDGDTVALQPFIVHAAAQYRNSSVGDAAVVNCRDRPDLQAAASGASLADMIGTSGFPGICRGWTMPDDPPVVARATTVPTLVMTGSVDPITPPVFARAAASVMGPNARVVEFAHVGHATAAASPCGAELVRQFISQPAAPVDTGCAAAVPPVTFR
jgi:pimeloyl-ACP methyl ester carboxylesterase